MLIGVISCVSIKDINESDYIGNFQEQEYDFFESFEHTTDVDFYYDLPFDLKFGGIRPFPYDSAGKQEYSWLRNPENLTIAFNTVKSIGLNRFVSIDQYNKLNPKWCCNTQWENKSLNQIVKEFINSDTTIFKNDYYSKFWSRRKSEGNLSETFHIFKQIDNFYNGNKNETGKINPVLKNLLDFDLSLAHSDSIAYLETSLKYFDYLKSVHLDYSAYKLTFHNKKFNYNRQFKDSLLMTIKHDTLTRDNWDKLNDNSNGWITWDKYPDPNKYYGP